jgi:hypothetical protein
MTVYLAISVMVGLDLWVWLMIRQFRRTGVILGSPWNINREERPNSSVFASSVSGCFSASRLLGPLCSVF